MKRKNILNSFSNKEIAQIVIEELEKAGAVYVAGTPEDIAGIILK